MGFFDNIDTDIFNDNITFDEYTSLYGVYSLNAVKTAKDMVEYIINISHINEILETIDVLSYNKICEYFSNNNIETFNNNIFTYTQQYYTNRHIEYIVLPNDNTEIRLIVEISPTHIHFEYFKNDTWWSLCSYIPYVLIEDDTNIIVNITKSLFNAFNNVTDFKFKYRDI